MVWQPVPRRLPQQPRGGRVVDEVVDVPTGQVVRGERRLVHARIHPDRRAVDQQVPAVRLGRPRSGLRRRQHRDVGGLLRVPGVDAHARAARRQRHGDRPRGPARAEHRGPQPVERTGDPSAVRGSRSRPCCRPPSVALDANRVDGADAPRHRVDLVQAVADRHLVGNRDAGALEADRPPERHEVVGARPSETGGTRRRGGPHETRRCASLATPSARPTRPTMP